MSLVVKLEEEMWSIKYHHHHHHYPQNIWFQIENCLYELLLLSSVDKLLVKKTTGFL